MKLIVMIPAYNEEETIGGVIRSIPQSIEGFDEVQILVIDDGSNDRTAVVAKESGAHFIVFHGRNRGLARAFQTGIDEALRRGADVIVNTDADHQYNQSEIPLLVRPILDHRADMVIGDRQIEKLTFMPWPNKYGNMLGSSLLRLVLKNNVRDASSGFRAFSKECALRLNVLSGHTYTHETIIQCTISRFHIAQVPITFLKREGGTSKLIQSVFSHIKKSLANIVRIYLVYQPLKTFSRMGIGFLVLGSIIYARYMHFYFAGSGEGHIQSLIFGLVFVITGILLFILGFIADLISAQRKIQQEILYHMKRNGSEK